MANEIDLDDYDFTDLHNYPNIGLNKDNEIVELSFDGNILLRPANTKIFLTEEAEAEIEKCKNDMFYFFETYCKIHTQDGGKVLVQLRPYQKEFLDLIHNNRRVIGLLARQVGKTTVNALYIVWNMCFQKDWIGMVVANEDELKKEIVDMIQTIYENLPSFLQIGVEGWNMSSVTLVGTNEDGKPYYNKLRSAVAGKNAGRGKTPNFVLSDESAWYDENKAKAYFDSIKASLSSGTNNKFVMVSTPQGYNIFHDYWKNAVEKKSDFKPYFANWKCVPGRDENWKLNKIKEDNLTPMEWAQNYECAFSGSSSTLLNANTLSDLSFSQPISNDFIHLDVKLYKEYNPNSLYAITVDSSKTVGKTDSENDYICVNVLELGTKIEQALTYRTNTIHYTELAQIIYDIGEHFDFPLCIVENNEGSGTYTANRLVETLEYPNMYYNPKKDGLEVGIRTTTGNRGVGLTTLKKLIENDILKVVDISTIEEFFTFIKVGKRYEAQKNSTDDCIMSLNLLMYILMDENNDLEITIDDYLQGEIEIKESEESENDVDFVGHINNGISVEDASWLYS